MEINRNVDIPKDGQEDYIIEDFNNIKKYFYFKSGFVPRAICNMLEALILLVNQYKAHNMSR